MKQQARLENWSELSVWDYGDKVLVGEIKDHPRQSMFHTDQQITSRLISIDREKGVAETENTIYTLGKEKKL